MNKPTSQLVSLGGFALLTVVVLTATLSGPVDLSKVATTPEQADTVRVNASTANNSASVLVVTNAITGDDYEVIAPSQVQPTANSAV